MSARARAGQVDGGAPPDEVIAVTSLPVPRRSRDVEFAAFMSASEDDLLRTAWFLVGNTYHAEDLAQEALARTYAAWSRARRDPLAYTRRVLVNVKTDTWRRRRREVLIDPSDLPEHPVSAAGAVESRDQIVRALGTLTPRQRRVVVLRYLLDLSEAEVAADLGISVGTVKSTASRALAQLREVPGARGAQGGGDGRAN